MRTARKIFAVLMILTALLFIGVGIDAPQSGLTFFLFGSAALLGYCAWALLRRRKIITEYPENIEGIEVEAERLRAALAHAAECGYISVAMLQRDARLYYVQAAQLIEALINHDYASQDTSPGKNPVKFTDSQIYDIIDYLANLKVVILKY